MMSGSVCCSLLLVILGHIPRPLARARVSIRVRHQSFHSHILPHTAQAGDRMAALPGNKPLVEVWPEGGS
jgi:hypothetical protein